MAGHPQWHNRAVTRRLPIVALGLACLLLLGACGAMSEAGPDVAASPSANALDVSSPAPLLPTPGIRVAAPLLAPGVVYGAVSNARVVDVWRSPRATADPELTLDTENAYGVQMPMLVAGARRGTAGDDWLKVLLPIRPNESTGWVRDSDVSLVPQREEIVVDLSDRVLRHYRDGKLVDRFSVGIGRPEYPTATGSFYVMIQVPQSSPSGPYGIFALGLSGFSEVIKNWPGGGRMAIHGTPNPADRGAMVSHGCIRVYNPDMRKLRRVPLGTPVVIRR
jgi:lipoprotein-anchoring transpeptidase ErfK/SrfK